MTPEERPDEALAQCGICDGFYDPTREEDCPRCGSAAVVERPSP